MRVVQINSECGRGSTGKIVLSISRLLSSKGIENYIFYSGNHKFDVENAQQINTKLDIRAHQLLSRLFGNQGFHSTFFTIRLVRKLKALNPDVIVLHNLHGYYLNIGILFNYLKKSSIPVYWTLHDCWAFTGHCTHFLQEDCSSWKKSCGKCPRLNKYPYSWFFDRSSILLNRKKELYGGMDNLYLITPSEWLSRLVKQSFLKEHDVTVIHNGIDTDVFKYTENGFKRDNGIENKPMILGVASVWSHSKGLDVFIKLSRIRPEWQIVLVGTDSNVEKQLPQNIISIHRTTNQIELAKIYSAADVFLNPTREDNYPTVNMEAISCGTPVVTFNTGGCAEIVKPQYGMVCENNSIDEAVSAIEHILQTIENCGLSVDSTEFHEEKCFKEYISLIMNSMRK